jgi:hypothetical protein
MPEYPAVLMATKAMVNASAIMKRTMPKVYWKNQRNTFMTGLAHENTIVKIRKGKSNKRVTNVSPSLFG